jgi:hypothetical protein
VAIVGFVQVNKREELSNSALAPPTPQFWGEKSRISGHFPPELGGQGGQCNTHLAMVKICMHTVAPTRDGNNRKFVGPNVAQWWVLQQSVLE